MTQLLELFDWLIEPQGACDSDHDCFGSLTCGKDNCQRFDADASPELSLHLVDGIDSRLSEIGVGMHTLLPGHKTWNLLDISHTWDIFGNNGFSIDPFSFSIIFPLYWPNFFLIHCGDSTYFPLFPSLWRGVEFGQVYLSFLPLCSNLKRA